MNKLSKKNHKSLLFLMIWLGIKGAIVDTKKGELISDRIRIPTPKP